jgi:ankyrin repeat protein
LTPDRHGDVEMVEALLRKGARVNEKNDDGATALTIAQEAGKTANVNLLRRHGAN